jgi:hypothetical protein
MINFNTKKVTREVSELRSITCSMCGTEYSDDMELQEFFIHDRIGGYSSVFGDEVQMQFELCQHCMKKIIISNNINVVYDNHFIG